MQRLSINKLSINKNMTQDEIKFKVIDIVSSLELHKIRLCMEKLDWTWGFAPEPPTQQELFQAAVEKGMDAVNGTIRSGGLSYKVSSGGFSAHAILQEDGDVGLSIWFEITDSDNYL